MSVDRISRLIVFVLGCLGTLAACDKSNDTSDVYQGPMVLAVSWQPGFCETRPRLPECRSQNATRFDARHLALHGLWPQPGSRSYCGVSEKEVALDKARRWRNLAPLELSKTVRDTLERIMPGARSHLHRHEWVKHGTCYSDQPEIYYRDSLLLMDQLNTSPIQQLFSRSIGAYLSAMKIRASFDSTYGKGAGKRVRVACKRDGNRTIITEITIGLAGSISEDSKIGGLILASPETRRGCPGGIVDAVGFQ